MPADKGPDVRDQLMAEIHLGHLRPGDRLPSIREVAERRGIDPRKLTRVYRELEKEGLIEIRGRSGVFLSREEEREQIRLGEFERWASLVSFQAWTRGIGVGEVGTILDQLTCTVRLKVLVVESSSDQIDQFAEELRDDFGLEVTRFNTLQPERRKDELKKALRAAALRVDLIVTTVFHGALVREIAHAAGKVSIVITMNDLATSRLEQLLSEGPFTLIAADPQHQERVEALLPQLRSRITVVPIEAVRGDKQRVDNRVFVTRSAKRIWPTAPWPLLFPYNLPIVCPAAAQELCGAIVAANLGAAKKIKARLLKN